MSKPARRFDCVMILVARNWHLCQACGWLYYGPTAPRRNCPEGLTAREARATATAAGERLGITPAHVIRYARALLRWTAAGFPVRTDAEVAAIWSEHCEPCDQLIGDRCKKCGCRNAAKGWAVTTKGRMETEHCPEGKW